MTNKKTTKRALLSSALALLVCFAMLLGTTFAWFTDEAKSSGNKIVSGTLKVDLELLDKDTNAWASIKENNDPIFNYEKWEPGFIDAKVLKVENEGTLALKWKAKFVSAEELSELADVIDVYVLAWGVRADDNVTDVKYPENRDLVAAGYTRVGTVREFVNTIESTTYGNLLEGESAYLGLALKMQESANNDYQEKTLGAFDIQIVATQMASENDSFGNDYDAGAEFDGEISNATGLAAAVKNGGAYKLVDNVTLTSAVEVAEGVTVSIDLNGKQIISGSDGYAIKNENGGTVVITDSDAPSESITYARRAIPTGGAIFGVVCNGEDSDMTIEAGTFTAVDKHVFLNVGGNLTINGGTVNGGTSYPIYSYGENHNLVINDVTVNATFGCVNAYDNGTVEINGGKFTMTGVEGKTSHIAYFSTGTVAVINGGDFAKIGDINMSASGGGGICVYGSANLTINGGSFSGDYADVYNWGNENASLKVRGGEFTYVLPENVVPNDCTVVDGDNGDIVVAKLLTKKNGGLYVETDATDNRYYVSNSAGLANLNAIMADKSAGKNTKVTLLADIDFTGKTWTPVDSHADTAFYMNEIDGNGHTIYNLTVNGQAMFKRFAGVGNVVIKNITFDGAVVNSNGSINTSILTVHSYQNVLLDNVDVKNSTITGGYKVAPLIATVYNESSSTITATLKNCDVENVVVTATSYDFCTTGMVAFVYADDNDKIEFENCTVTNVQLYAPNVYTAHAAIYTTGSGTLFNEAEGVTVTNVTFENIK